MIYILWTVIIFLTFIVQGSISLFDVTPNFTFLLVYYIGLKKGEVKGMLFGSLIGIIEDSLSGSFIGPHIMGKGLVGYLSSSIYGRFFIWTPLLGIVIISILTLTDSSAVFLSRSIFHKMPMSISAALFTIFIQSLMNSLFGIFIKPRYVKGETKR